MPPSAISFQITDWKNIGKTTHLADHWCQKGHIVYCLKGEFTTELQSGESFTLTEGMSYIVSDDLSSHRSTTENGVKLLIVDGDFLW